MSLLRTNIQGTTGAVANLEALNPKYELKFYY